MQTPGYGAPQPPPVTCRKCRSPQVTASSKGFSAGKAIGGALLVGPLGLLGGMHGRGKVLVTCLACGHQWDPSVKPAAPTSYVAWVVLAAIALLLGSCSIAMARCEHSPDSTMNIQAPASSTR